MKMVGLTGGIASGKSTVASFFRELGATIVDADAVYHGLLEPVAGRPSPLMKKIASSFPNVVGSHGGLDRPALAREVFSTPEKLQKLNTITHPAVAAEVRIQTQQALQKGAPGVIYDVPLLYENNLQSTMLGVIVVWVPRTIQQQRLCLRNGLTPEEAERRLRSQLAIDDKRSQGDWVIDNSGNLDHTKAQVQAVWQQLLDSVFSD